VKVVIILFFPKKSVICFMKCRTFTAEKKCFCPIQAIGTLFLSKKLIYGIFV